MQDDAASLDFDQAAAYRLWWFDLAAEDRLAQKIANAIWAGLGTPSEDPATTGVSNVSMTNAW